ncbi:MAG: hypothetical protein IIB62_10415 [Proteobacteria bacterium]|nr:hypothetical protein [Pseudomonadota bacterium]
MLSAIINMARLMRAGFTVLRHGARVVPEDANLPQAVRIFARLTAPLRARARKDG